MEYTKYAAVGHFKCHRTLAGKKYPVVIVGRKEYMLDVQEMTVWSSLAWRILSRSQIAETYLKLTRGLSFTSRRTLDDCIDRLVTRGLVAEGRGSSEYEALYDLLSCLYIAPVSANPFLRLGAFLKLWICNGAPFSKAIRLFSRPKQDAAERQIVRLANQALLSGAELIRCVERSVRTLHSDAHLMDCLYNDDLTTSQNLPILMEASRQAPLIRKWLLSLLLCLPFLIAAIVSAFSGDRTFLMLSALLLLFCSIRCAELYALLKNERYHAEEGVCLTVSRIPFSRQRSVTLQKVDGSTVVFCAERNMRLTAGQAYRVYFPTHAVVGEVGNACLSRPCALAVERIEVSASAGTEPSS